MKKQRILVMAALLCSIAAFTAGPARAAEFSLGPVIEYAWWNPMFRNSFSHFYHPFTQRTSFSMENSSLMYGIAIGVSVSERWDLSGSFLFCLHNQFNARAKSFYYELNPVVYLRAQDKRVGSNFGAYSAAIKGIDRYDASVTAGYSISKIITFFFGARTEVYTFDGSYRGIFGNGSYIDSAGGTAASIDIAGIEGTGWSLGPVFGGRFNVNLYKSLFLNTSLSAIVMAGRHDIKIKWLIGNATWQRALVYSYGGRATLSLGYVFESARTSVSLGAYYRVLRFGAISSQAYIEGALDHLYGTILSVQYSF